MGCGVCAPRCPSGAIVLDRAAHTGDPLDLNFLLPRPADTPQRTDEVSTR
jgi:ferredoxin